MDFKKSSSESTPMRMLPSILCSIIAGLLWPYFYNVIDWCCRKVGL